MTSLNDSATLEELGFDAQQATTIMETIADLKDKRMLLVCGRPGGGKTTTVEWLARQLEQKYPVVEFDRPIETPSARRLQISFPARLSHKERGHVINSITLRDAHLPETSQQQKVLLYGELDMSDLFRDLQIIGNASDCGYFTIAQCQARDFDELFNRLKNIEIWMFGWEIELLIEQRIEFDEQIQKPRMSARIRPKESLHPTIRAAAENFACERLAAR